MNLYRRLSEIGMAHHYECSKDCIGRQYELDMCMEILDWVREFIVEKGLKNEPVEEA